MTLFDEYVATLAAVGGALVNAAEGVFPGQAGPNDGDHVALNQKVQAAYIIARVNVAVAEALAKQAALETGAKAVELVKQAALLVGTSEQKLIDAAAAAKTAVVQDVTDAYQKAVDVGAAALKNVHDTVKSDVTTFLTIELVAGLGIAGLAIWWLSKQQQPSASDMRRAILASEGMG